MIEIISLLVNLSAAVQSGAQAGADIYNGYQNRKLERIKFAEECRQQERTQISRIEEQKKYFEEKAKLQITDYFLQHSWPLSLSPEFMNSRYTDEDNLVLRVLVAPFFGDSYEQNRALNYAKHSLQEKISTLARHDVGHKIDFLFDIWKEGHRGMQAELESLYSILNGRPTLVLFPRFTNSESEIIIYGASWGIGNVNSYPKVEQLDIINLERLYISCAREYAKRWRDTMLSIPTALANETSCLDSFNLAILENHEKLKGNSFNTEEFDAYFHSTNTYKINDVRFDKAVGDTVANHLAVIIHAVADIYNYVEYKKQPRLAIVLAYLNQHFFLENVTPKYLGIFNRFSSLISTSADDNDTEIKDLGIIDLVIKLGACFAGIKLSETYSTEDFVTRLLWDEFTSECFRDMLRVGINQSNTERAFEELKTIFGQIENNLSDTAVRSVFDNILHSNDLLSILFSYSKLHPLIREIKTRSERASFILYDKTKTKGGVNWLVAMNLSSAISNEAKTNREYTTPSILIKDCKGFISERINMEYQKYNINVDAETLNEITSYGRFIENIRILSDIFFNL